jgi:hypothetical protein
MQIAFTLPMLSFRPKVNWNLYYTRRARSSEKREAPMRKSANKEFDPKAFLAKVGVGKTILKFGKNQRVFEQGDVADTVFYIQKGRVKLTVLSEQGKEAVVGILEPGQFFGERQWPYIAHRDHDGDGRMRDHLNHQRSDDLHPSFRAEIFRAVHGISVDTEQPS